MTAQWPETGEVHIRWIDLAVDTGELNRLEQLLSPDERKRAAQLIDQQFRNRFIAGRAHLRRSLAGYLGCEPADLILTTGPHGKPSLSQQHDRSRLSFNLSHSDNLAVLALCAGCEVGIDLEQVRYDLPFQAMARQFFSRREQVDLFSLPAELQLDAFYRCWTRKEAYLKGCGSGFSQPADLCDVSLLPGQPPGLLAHRDDPAQAAEWMLTDLEVPSGFCAALALQTQTRQLQNRKNVLRLTPVSVSYFMC